MYFIIVGAIFAAISIVSWSVYSTVVQYSRPGIFNNATMSAIPAVPFNTTGKYVMITDLVGTPYTPLVYRSIKGTLLVDDGCVALVSEVEPM
jgi:hypothetical protein